MSSNKNRLRTSQPNIFETQLQKYQNIPSAWLCKVQPLYKSACLCTSLIVSRWKCVCLTGVCVCVCVRSRSRVFFLPCYGSCFTWGKKWNESYLPQPVHRAPVRTSCQKPTPAAFPLCLFQEILITRLRLQSEPRPLLFLFTQRTALLCVCTTFWLMVFTLTPHVCWFGLL